MAFLYHRVPKNMEGSVLYPLNELRKVHPEIAVEAGSKYANRPQLMEFRIPILDCLWNDVLHFSILSPELPGRELKKLGHPFEFVVYEFDPHLLDPEKTVLYINKERERGTLPPEKDFIAYNPDDLDRWDYFPPETARYYKEMVEQGKLPLMYHGIPHVLFKGSINIASVPIKIFA